MDGQNKKPPYGVVFCFAFYCYNQEVLELITKIFYFIFILPFFVAEEGYKMLKKFFAKHGLTPDWAYAWLVILFIILILVVLFERGYN